MRGFRLLVPFGGDDSFGGRPTTGPARMRCPTCHSSDSKVLDTRITKEGDAIRRRRKCDRCDHRFTTREYVVGTDFVVIKRDGTRAEYDPDKVRRGVSQACWKRSVTQEVVDNLVSATTRRLLQMMENEIPSARIGEIVMEGLKELDEVAYVRFASVYRRFKDIDEFINEVQSLSDSQVP